MRQFKYEIGQVVYYKNVPNEIVNRYYDKTQESNAYDLVCRLNGHSKEPRVYIEIKEDAILDARPKFPRKKKKNQEQNFSEGNTQQSNGQTLIDVLLSQDSIKTFMNSNFLQTFISSDILKKLEVIINHHYNQIMPKIKNDGSVEFVNYPNKPEIMFGNTSNVINKQKDSFVKKYKSKIMRMGLYNYITVDGNINDVKKHLEEFARIRETKSFRFHVEIKTYTKCKIIRVK
jgi:hypothetical protein